MKDKKCHGCDGVKGWSGSILWLLALVAVVIGWWQRASVVGYLGLNFDGWLQLALVLSILSLPCLLLGGCSRGHGHCGDGNCKTCK